MVAPDLRFLAAHELWVSRPADREPIKRRRHVARAQAVAGMLRAKSLLVDKEVRELYVYACFLRKEHQGKAPGRASIYDAAPETIEAELQRVPEMTDAVSFLIIELIRAANETSKMTPAATARLLQRAAASIREYRKQITSSYIPAKDTGEGDIVFELTVMANSIDLFPPEQILEMLLEAAEEIKACKALIEKG